MDRAPIPPHERSWRHPSEPGPTPPPTPQPSSTGRVVALATGAVAATLVVVLAVTVLPRRAPAPTAISATTLPPFSVAAASELASPATAPSGVSSPPDDPDTAFAPVRLERSAIAAASGLALTGAPRSVAVPIQTPDVAPPSSPAGDEIVHLVTTSHVYRLTWADLERTIAPDGTIVVDQAGHVVGSFVDGRFVSD